MTLTAHLVFAFSPIRAVGPEIDKSTLLRAATGVGERGRLPCRILASPKPNVQWARNGQPLNTNNQTSPSSSSAAAKYHVEFRQIDPLTYESVLLIEKTTPADLERYECIASNDLGTTRDFISLVITSHPDPPANLTVLNVTHDSVTLRWQPGFDGGLKANFRIRYREANSEHYRYEDGIPNVNQLTVTGLRMNTVYLFSVMAINGLGNSTYLPDLVKAHTKGMCPQKWWFGWIWKPSGMGWSHGVLIDSIK